MMLLALYFETILIDNSRTQSITVTTSAFSLVSSRVYRTPSTSGIPSSPSAAAGEIQERFRESIVRQLTAGCASRLPNEQLYNGRILVGVEANRLGTRNGVGTDTVTHFTLPARYSPAGPELRSSMFSTWAN